MPKLELCMLEAKLSGIKSGTVTVNSIKLYYVQQGEGPNLILLHGGLGCSN